MSGLFFNTSANKPRGPPPRGPPPRGPPPRGPPPCATLPLGFSPNVPPPSGPPMPLGNLNPFMSAPQMRRQSGAFSSGAAVHHVGAYNYDQQVPSWTPPPMQGHSPSGTPPYMQRPGPSSTPPPMQRPGPSGTPPLMQRPSPCGTPPLMQGPAPSGQSPRNNLDPLALPMKLEKLAGVKPGQNLWVSAVSAQGKEYYYKTLTRQTAWEKPPNAVIITQNQLTEFLNKAHCELANEHSEVSGDAKGAPEARWLEFTAQDGRKYYHNPETNATTWDKPKEWQEEHSDAGSVQMDDSAASDTPSGRTSPGVRPICSNAVVGTGWCVVWTSDNKVFFFNPTTRSSIWERPPELYNRPDVDLLISKRPSKKQLAAKVEEGAPGQPQPLIIQENIAKSDDEDEEQPPPPPPLTEAPSPSGSTLSRPSPHESPRVDDPAIQAELDAQRERQEKPLEDRLRIFKEMLEEKGVSAGSTFERELSKIVFDKRYLLLSAAERRAAFESFVKKKSGAERKERRRSLKENKKKFRELLEKSDLHSKSSFSKFARRNGRDERFKCIETMREREDLFYDFIDEMQERKREERKRKKEKEREPSDDEGEERRRKKEKKHVPSDDEGEERKPKKEKKRESSHDDKE